MDTFDQKMTAIRGNLGQLVPLLIPRAGLPSTRNLMGPGSGCRIPGALIL